MKNAIHHSPSPRRGLAVLVLAMIAAWTIAPATARADAPLEDKIKSAFIFSFIQFVDWPENTFAKPDDPIIIGVLEKDPMEAAIAAAVDGKTVKGRKIVVKHFAPGAVGPCQVLYLGDSDQAADVLKGQAGKPVLTIGATENFTDAGGIIRFYLEDRKERFEINQAAADRAKLQISSKLLKLAKIVNK